MMPLATILLVIALVAIYAWRKLDHMPTPTGLQIQAANLGDSYMLICVSRDHGDHRHPDDDQGHSAGAEFSDSPEAG